MFRIVIFFLFSSFFLTSCSLQWHTPKPTVETGTGQAEVGVELAATGQTREERLEESKRRKNFKSIIRKGDYFSLKNDREVALKYYLSAYIRLKDDNVLERKIAGAYFALKDFGNAYKYFKRVPFADLDEKEKEEAISAIMFDEQTSDKKAEIEKFPISVDDKAFYGYMETCYTGIHNCVVSLEAYSGSYERIKKLSDITRDYKKVSTDFQYRNMLLAGALFETKQYLASAKIAEEITSKRPDYYVALKIAGYSYYELGKYQEANRLLARYYAFDPKNVKTAYTLGLTNFYLEDYTTSNLYFNTAVLNGYTPKTELERRMVYNYYILNDRKSIFKILRYLLEESDVSEDDYVIAVHTAIEQKEMSKWLLWANKGIEKFASADMLYALRAMIHLQRNDQTNAAPDIEESISLNPRNFVALLARAKLHFMKNEYTLAKEDAESVKEIDTDGVFAEEAKILLEDIVKQESIASNTGIVSTGSNR